MKSVLIHIQGWVKLMALTEQEKKILALEAKGFSDYQIARRLHSNSGTVFRQRKRAHVKLEKAQSDLDFTNTLKKGSK
jgi:DNA-binding NarL/FixJ family response regulator